MIHETIIFMSTQPFFFFSAFKYDTERDTFNAMWGRKEGIEVVLTNIRRTEPIGTRMSIIDHIEKDFKLTTFCKCNFFLKFMYFRKKKKTIELLSSY